MPDKDQFTFHDEDGFPVNSQSDRDGSSDVGLSDDDLPETDFSTIFPEDEHSVEAPEERDVAGVKAGDPSRTRIMLLILLLVVAGASGAYFFLDLGGTSSVGTELVPAAPGTKSVSLPPQPVPVPMEQTQSEPAAKNVTVAVPPPPPQPVDATKPQDVTGDQQSGQAPVESSPATEAASAPKEAATQPDSSPASELPAAAKQTASIQQVEDDAYALDAGSYLLESNRKALVEKIKQMGYEPLVTPLNATLNMTRLRLGTFSKDEIQEALALARTIEPGSYSMPAGEGYVIYAGTFLKRDNVDKLSLRFAAEGIKVYPEPVQVVRTLSPVRFGRFATREDAAAASREVGAAGLKAEVVKAK